LQAFVISMKNLNILFIFLFYCNAIIAQTSNNLKVVVLDSISKSPIEYAAVSILKQSDKRILTGGLTDEKGMIVFTEIISGIVIIKVEFIAYKPYIKENIVLDANNIQRPYRVLLSSASTQLHDVTITAEKQAIIQSIDKKIVNVDQLNANNNGTLIDILIQVPNITVDQDGNISMRGSDRVNIMIDGKPRALTTPLLAQLPASTIQSIEIITNPSAKYDPEGTSGILNIITKKNRLSGTNGSVSVGASTNNKYSTAINMTHQIRKWSIFINAADRYDNRWRYSYGERYFNFGIPTRFVIDSKGQMCSNNASTRGGMEYNINKKHQLYLNGMISYNPEKGQDSTYYTVDENSKHTDKRLENNSSLNRSNELELGYKISFNKPKHQIIFDLFRSENENQKLFDYTIRPLDYSGIHILNDTEQANKNKVLNFQIDYSLPIQQEGLIEIGTRYTDRIYRNTYDINNTQNINYTVQHIQFDYNDVIKAAYFTFANKYSKFGIKGGLRIEDFDASYNSQNTMTNGINELLDSEYHRTDYFPSVFFTYDITKDLIVQLGYSKRINRPGFNALNPIQDVNDPYSIRRGNPNLSPEYIHSLEWNVIKYLKTGSIGAAIYYRNTQNAFVRFVSIDTNNILVVQLTNSNALNAYGLDINTNIKLTSIWNLNAGFGIFNNQLLARDVNKTIWVGKGNIMNIWKIFPKTELQLSARYSTPWATPQGKGIGHNAIDISWKQKLMNDKLSIVASVNDIFDSQSFKIKGQDPTIKYDFERKRESRIANITLIYFFGKIDTKPSKPKKQADLPMQGGDGGF